MMPLLRKIIILAKAPVPGFSKTRIAEGTSPGFAAALSEALLRDTVEAAARVPHASFTLCVDPPEKSHWFRSNFGLPVVMQRGATLGERMFNAFVDIGCPAVLIGSDIPLLTPDIFRDAFDALLRNEVVFGPTHDGGYYLVGMNTLRAEVFAGVTYSQPDTLRQTVELATAAGLSVGRIALRHDIDTVEDLERLKWMLRINGSHRHAPHLTRFLGSNANGHPVRVRK